MDVEKVFESIEEAPSESIKEELLDLLKSSIEETKGLIPYNSISKLFTQINSFLQKNPKPFCISTCCDIISLSIDNSTTFEVEIAFGSIIQSLLVFLVDSDPMVCDKSFKVLLKYFQKTTNLERILKEISQFALSHESPAVSSALQSLIPEFQKLDPVSFGKKTKVSSSEAFLPKIKSAKREKAKEEPREEFKFVAKGGLVFGLFGIKTVEDSLDFKKDWRVRAYALEEMTQILFKGKTLDPLLPHIFSMGKFLLYQFRSKNNDTLRMILLKISMRVLEIPSFPLKFQVMSIFEELIGLLSSENVEIRSVSSHVLLKSFSLVSLDAFIKKLTMKLDESRSGGPGSWIFQSEVLKALVSVIASSSFSFKEEREKANWQTLFQELLDVLLGILSNEKAIIPKIRKIISDLVCLICRVLPGTSGLEYLDDKMDRSDFAYITDRVLEFKDIQSVSRMAQQPSMGSGVFDSQKNGRGESEINGDFVEEAFCSEDEEYEDYKLQIEKEEYKKNQRSLAKKMNKKMVAENLRQFKKEQAEKAEKNKIVKPAPLKVTRFDDLEQLKNPEVFIERAFQEYLRSPKTHEVLEGLDGIRSIVRWNKELVFSHLFPLNEILNQVCFLLKSQSLLIVKTSLLLIKEFSFNLKTTIEPQIELLYESIMDIYNTERDEIRYDALRVIKTLGQYTSSSKTLPDSLKDLN